MGDRSSEVRMSDAMMEQCDLRTDQERGRFNGHRSAYGSA